MGAVPVWLIGAGGGSANGRKAVKLTCVFGTALIILPVFVLFALVAALTTAAVHSQSQSGCGTTTTGTGSGGTISAKQAGYARTIIGIGKTMTLSQDGWTIAIMVTLAESSLQEYANSNVPASLNYPHDAVGSDHGSVGIFQQQVNYDGSNFGWGTLDQLMNATDGVQYQAYRFYRALEGVAGWQGMSPWLAAQAVQRSAFSDGSNYQVHYAAAQAIVSNNLDAPPVPLPAGATSGSPSPGPGGTGCTTTGNASTQSIAQAASALDAMNIPYCWGGGHTQPAQINYGAGPSVCFRGPGLDCSGAVAYVLQHAGMSSFQTDVASGYMSLPWQKLGSGIAPVQVSHAGVQLYASSAHTFLVINGKVFSSDTVHSPTGGPHWRTWDASAEESGDGAIAWVILQVPGTA